MVKLERHVQHVRTHLGRNIRNAREAEGIDRKELADAVGASEEMIAEIEAGARNMPLNMLVCVARKLRVRMSDLFTEG